MAAGRQYILRGFRALILIFLQLLYTGMHIEGNTDRQTDGQIYYLHIKITSAEITATTIGKELYINAYVSSHIVSESFLVLLQHFDFYFDVVVVFYLILKRFLFTRCFYGILNAAINVAYYCSSFIFFFNFFSFVHLNYNFFSFSSGNFVVWCCLQFTCM